ncbi:MAG: hypothetical protein JWN44_1884 [Myxococcales bacterium]|nr:hypothetical protein [Myxococcales bacterium]
MPPYPATLPEIVFSTPRGLPDARKLRGRVAVVDIAFAADGMGTPFAETTAAFIRDLGGRLAAWVDHHDHERHVDYASDRRFTLSTKAQHGACPEMVTPEVVREAGPVDTIVAHLDLDGLYSAVKWVLGGVEPYPGADDDARAVDTRIGEVGPTGAVVDKAMRAHFRDEGLKHRIIRWLIDGMKDKALGREIAEAAADFDRMAAESTRLAALYERRGKAVFVDAGALAKAPFDKTMLLLEGQKQAPVAIVRDAGMITLAAAFDSGIDFIKLLDLGGGMPTRVSIKEARLDEALAKLNG